MSPVALDEIVTEVASLLDADRRRADVTLNLALEPRQVSGATVQLAQLVLNLVRNGLQACESKGRVDVSLTCDHQRRTVRPRREHSRRRRSHV